MNATHVSKQSSCFDIRKKHNAFTMVELLIVILVLGVLALIVFTVVNTGEIMKQTRDSMRMSDLQQMNKVLSMANLTGNSLGSANTVYLSLPDSNANCSSYTLPTLPGGWSYACRPAASYRNIDGTGWIPVNTSNSGSTVAKLLIDPINSVSGSSRFYYSYMAGVNRWELNAPMEALNDSTGGSNDKVSTDGGDDHTKFEVGTNLSLAPWSFEFAAFPQVANNSGFPGWFKASGTGTVSIGSDGTAANYLNAVGYVWYDWQENIPFNPNAMYMMTCKVRQITDPTVGGKGFYCGWEGVGADGTTRVNVTGGNSSSSQHYHTMANTIYTAGAGWNSRTGYTKGWAAAGSGSSCTNSASPCFMHQDVRYIRPMFIAGYSAGDGVSDIDSIVLTKM